MGKMENSVRRTKIGMNWSKFGFSLYYNDAFWIAHFHRWLDFKYGSKFIGHFSILLLSLTILLQFYSYNIKEHIGRSSVFIIIIASESACVGACILSETNGNITYFNWIHSIFIYWNCFHYDSKEKMTRKLVHN